MGATPPGAFELIMSRITAIMRGALQQPLALDLLRFWDRYHSFPYTPARKDKPTTRGAWRRRGAAHIVRTLAPTQCLSNPLLPFPLLSASAMLVSAVGWLLVLRPASSKEVVPSGRVGTAPPHSRWVVARPGGWLAAGSQWRYPAPCPSAVPLYSSGLSALGRFLATLPTQEGVCETWSAVLSANTPR